MEEKEFTPKVGDLVIIDGNCAAVIYGRSKDGRLNVFNIVDLNVMQFVETFSGGLHNAERPTTEQRRKYWDFISHVGDGSALPYLPHSDEEEIYQAGTVLVIGEKFITICATDVPVHGKHNMCILNTRYLKSWRCTPLKARINMPTREATEEERVRFFATCGWRARRNAMKYERLKKQMEEQA